MIYSPSSREEYAFCPRKWWLRQRGYESVIVGKSSIAALGGIAVSKAMEFWNVQRMMTQSVSEADLINLAQSHYTDDVHSLGEDNHTFSVDAVDFNEQMPALIERAIHLLYTEDPLKSYTILSAEGTFPGVSNARFDVLVTDGLGSKCIFDYKCKFTPTEDRYLNGNMDEYGYGEQRLTYTSLSGADMFGIICVVLQPTKSRKPLTPRLIVRTWPVTDAEKQTWWREASLITPFMDSILALDSPEKVPGRPFPHATKYGPCPYQALCLDYNFDPTLSQLDYITIEKGE